jgi:hypothetical protein
VKRYKDMMDQVEAPEELHQRLTGLTAPKKAAPRKRYGAIAAAFALAVGIGTLGWRMLGQTTAPSGTTEIGQTEPAIGSDTIGIDSIGEYTDGGAAWDTDGGYEVVDGEVTSYYILPAIIYNSKTASSSVAADYALGGPDDVSREAGRADVPAMLADKTDMAVHLLWGDDLDWGGQVWLTEDGTAVAAALYADGAKVFFSLELLAGQEVPDCITYPDDAYERTQFCGAEITGLKNVGYMVREDGTELRESRRVSCFANGVGYKMTIYGTDGETVEAMCARFIRYAAAEGFDLSALSEGGSAADGTNSGGQSEVPEDETGEADQASTSAYDPAGEAPVPNSTPEP